MGAGPGFFILVPAMLQGQTQPLSQCEGRWRWAQSWAKPRGSVSVESCWEGSEAQGPGPAPRSGMSTICSDGAEVGQGRGGGTAPARLCPSSCGLPESVEQGQGGGGAWPKTRARVTGQLPGESLGVHTLSNFLWL